MKSPSPRQQLEFVRGYLGNWQACGHDTDAYTSVKNGDIWTIEMVEVLGKSGVSEVRFRYGWTLDNGKVQELSKEASGDLQWAYTTISNLSQSPQRWTYLGNYTPAEALSAKTRKFLKWCETP